MDTVPSGCACAGVLIRWQAWIQCRAGARERVFLLGGKRGYSAERVRERVFLLGGKRGYSAERVRVSGCSY